MKVIHQQFVLSLFFILLPLPIANAEMAGHEFMVMEDNGHALSSLPKGNAGVTREVIESGGGLQSGNSRDSFRTKAGFTHFDYSDAIVYPNQPGAAHLHTFVGNASVNAFTNKDNIRQCQSAASGGTANCSAYWFPSLMDENGDALVPYFEPSSAGNPPRGYVYIYYKAHHLNNSIQFQAPPTGMKIIAGDAKNTPQTNNLDPKYFHWDCVSNNNESNRAPHIPNCSPGQQVMLTINFPNCWDGTSLDSDDHQSHVAFSDRNSETCPLSHPVAIPQITYRIRYMVGPNGTRGWKLSSDMYEVNDSNPGGYSIHADWINGWNPEIMDRFVNNCLNQRVDCGTDFLNDGESLDESIVYEPVTDGDPIKHDGIAVAPSPPSSSPPTPSHQRNRSLLQEWQRYMRSLFPVLVD